LGKVNRGLKMKNPLESLNMKNPLESLNMKNPLESLNMTVALGVLITLAIAFLI
jgi:hypothetical protein